MVQATRRSWLWGVVAAAAIVATARGQSGVTLSAVVVPAAAQPGVHTVAVTGSGFPAGTIPASNVTVTLVPAAGGASATTPATGVLGLYAGTRRVSFQVPTAIAVSNPTLYRVSIAGTTDAGTAFASTAPVTFTINPPSQILLVAPSAMAPASTVAVQIVTRYTEFVAGATMATFGADASVGGGPVGGFGPVSVTGPTSATAMVTLAAGAASGDRTVTVATGVQTATLVRGFTVTSTTAPNQAPHITSAPVTAATALQPYAYQATATDADNDTLTWALTTAPSGMAIVPATGAIAWTPAAALAGTHTVTVQVSDGKGGLDTQTFAVVVAAAHVNQAPHITTTPGTAATAGQAYAYAPAATDADGDTLTWSLTQSPTGMGIVPATGAITWTPISAQVGGQTVTVSVADGHGGTDSQTFAIAVARPPNQAPRITSAAVTGATATQGYAYGVTATDADGDPLTFALTTAPAGMAIDPATGAITWTPSVSQVGPQAVTVQVSDGRSGSDTQGFTVTVAPAGNQAPTPRLSGPAAGTVGQSLSFDAGTSTDPDADVLSFSWSFGDGATAVGATATHSYATSGTFTVTLTVNDGHGHTPTATRSVVVSPPPNRPPVAVAGGPYSGESGIPVALTGTGSSDPDGDALIYAWSFGDQSTGSGPSPSHAYAGPGTYTVTLTVTDTHQATASSTTSVTIAPAVDRAPPLVTLNAPREALPGATVTISVGASDNDRVSSVVLEVEGEAPATFTAAPYSRTFTLPTVAAPGAVIHLKATATDPAGNTAQSSTTLTVASQPDTQPPTATLTAPAQAARGAVVTLSADARDNVGVSSVTFTANGAPIGTVTASPYVITWTVPTDGAAGPVFALVATVTDSGGLTGSASASLTAVAAAAAPPDPSVTLTVPATVSAGGSMDLTAAPVADPTVASVSFTVDGARVATLVAPPFSARYAVPTSLRNGATLQVQAEVTDGLGRTARDTRTTTVQASAAPGQGVLFGRVFDDTTGLPVANATVTLLSTTTTATTDPQGRYTIAASEGPGTLAVTKSGWSRVDRPVTFVAGNTASRVLDARLTPLAAAGAPVPAVIGGTVSQSGWTLVVPGGSLAANTALAMTAVGGQGLEGRLPLGWSPVAAVDVTPHGGALGPAATLKARNQASSAARVLARWDETASAWRAVLTTNGPTLEAAIVSTGQYAWLRPDVAPAAPAMPADGALLGGVPPLAIPDAAAARVTPDPRILFYSPGVGSTVTGLLTSPSPLPSGTPVTLALNESYRFLNGTGAAPERVTQDLVVYQSAAGPTDLEAVFPATPSLVFEAIALRDGVITAAVYAPGAEVGATLIGASGGLVTGSAGEAIDIPAGAGPATPMTLATLTEADAALTLPADTTWLAGVTFSFLGELTQPGRLSVAKPVGLASADQVLVVRARESNGETSYLLVSRARFDGDRLVTDVTLPGSSELLEGIRVPGRYLFLQVASPLAFSVGGVSGVSGGPFAGARITNDRLGIGALSSPAGRYAQAMPGGAVTLTALDEVKHDTGTAGGTVIAGVTTTLDLALVAQPPSVAAILPADAATNVALSDPVIVRFSEPVAPATVTPQAVLLTGPGGPVPATLTLTSNDTIATLRPVAPLDGDTVYTVTVDTTITDLAGYALAARVTARFTSLKTTPPPAPPAGNLSATIPANGRTTVAGTQGSAGLHDTVTIVNVTRKTSTPALVDPNGGFSAVVPAVLADELSVEITDPSGNKTVAALPAFRQVNADGSVSQVIGKNGGHMDGPNGIGLDAIADTFPSGAVVTIKAVPEADFPAKLTPEQAQVFSYTAGLTLDFGGATPQHYLNVSVPAGPNDKAEDGWVVSQVIQVDGQPVMNAVDTAKLIDGRVRTSSPPCPGVLAAGMYGIHKSAKMMAVIYGSGAMEQTADIYRAIASQSLGVGGSSDGVSMAMPAGAYFDRTFNFCLPIMTSRITLTRNTVDVLVPVDAIERSVVRLQVHDTAPSRVNDWDFSRDELYITVKVLTSYGGVHVVEATYPDGTKSVLPFAQAGEATGTTAIRVAIDALPATADGISVTSSGTGPTFVTTFLRADLRVLLRVEGGTADPLTVSTVDALIGGPAAPLPMIFTQASALGTGPLVVRALPGTIDPTLAEINAYNAEVTAWNAAHPTEPPRDLIALTGRYRTKVEIRHVNSSTNTLTEVPAASIVGGGFAFTFDSTLTPADKYSVVVSYAPPFPQEVIDLPVFTLRLSNAGNIVKVITLPAPPADQPLKLPALANDTVPPDLRGDLLKYLSFDPYNFLSFSFTEGMDAASMAQFKLFDSSGNAIAGRVIVSDQNTVLTFVPTTALKLNTTYTANFAGLTDLAGNHITNAAHLTMVVTTARPRTAGTVVFPNGAFPPKPKTTLLDLQFMDAPDAAGKLRNYAIAVTSELGGFKLATLDVTSPAAPTFVAGGFGGYYKNQILLVPNLDFALATRAQRGDTKNGLNTCVSPATPRFKGTMAITANANMTSSAVQFFDVTNPWKVPCMAGMKTLTANPDQYTSYTQPGTHHVLGFARASAVINTQRGPMAYTAVQGAGLIATEIAKNIPEIDVDKRQKDPMLPGDYSDVVAIGGDRLLALNADSGELHAIDPNLSIVGILGVSDPTTNAPTTLTVREGVPWDANEDGTIAPGEFLNLAIVGTYLGVRVVDVTQLDAMRVVASVPLPIDHHIRSLDFDPATRRVWVVTETTAYLIDLSGPPRIGLLDRDGDSIDDRIAWSQLWTDELFGIKLDSRGYVYLATSSGLEILTLARPNLHGTARFTHIPSNNVVGLDFDHAELRPARRVRVVAKDAGGNVIQATYTDELGRYELSVPPNADITVEMRAIMGSMAEGNQIEVDKLVWTPGANPGDPSTKSAGTVHTLVKNVHTAATGEAVLDLEAKTEFDAATRTYPAGAERLGGAFNILDILYNARKKLFEADPATALDHLTVVWSPGVENPGTAMQAGTLWVDGGFTTNPTTNIKRPGTDEYDPAVMLHEYSHSLIQARNLTDSPGGSHSDGDVLDPRMSFSEGLVTAIGNILADTPWYIDTGGADNSPKIAYSLESGPCTYKDPTNAIVPCTRGPFDEFAVSALFWDFCDGVASAQNPDAMPPNDGVALGFPALWSALNGPMKTYNTGFTTVYPLVYYLSQPYRAWGALSPTWTAIQQLLAYWQVEVPADEAGPNLYVDVPTDGTRVTVFPFGPPPTAPKGPKTGDPLGTRDDYGKPNWYWDDPTDPASIAWTAENKAYNRVFLRIKIPTGLVDYQYLLMLTRTPADVAVRVYVHDGRGPGWDNEGHEFDANIGVPVGGTMKLESGKTYLVEVMSGPDSGANDVGPATFTVRLRKF